MDRFFYKGRFYLNDAKGFYCWKFREFRNMSGCMDSTKGRKHPLVKRKTEEVLREFLLPHSRRFCSMLGKNYDWCHNLSTVYS